MGAGVSALHPPWSMIRWRVSPDRRQFAVSYTINTTTWIMPLCFSAWTNHEHRWLVLDVDSNGVVTSTRTVGKEPFNSPIEPTEWLTIFDQSTRQKLFSAGVFPSDEEVLKIQRMRDEARMKSQELREEMKRRAATRSMNR